jgi:hypothetical protein
MGQTQLLLIILAVLLLGVAIYVGIAMFGSNTEEASRNAMIHDLQNFAAQAYAFYTKPIAQGGGGKSFSKITIRTVFPPVENLNARYFIESASDDNCVITGVGRIVASNGDSLLVRVRVTPQRNFVEIVN